MMRLREEEVATRGSPTVSRHSETKMQKGESISHSYFNSIIVSVWCAMMNFLCRFLIYMYMYNQHCIKAFL